MKQKFFDKTILKFLLVGVANTLVGYGVAFVLLNLFGFDEWVSSAANYVVGSVLSYFLNKYFTFQQKKSSFKEVLRFVLNILVCYGISHGIAIPLVNYLLSSLDPKLTANLAMLAGTGLFMVLNYLGQRFFAFKKK